MRYTPLRVMESVNAAFLRISRAEIKGILSRKERLSLRHGMGMFTDRGKPRTIDVQLRPWAVDARQLRFFHRTCLLLRASLSRVLPLYLNQQQVRRVVPLPPQEHAWVMEINAGGLQRPQAVVDRLDATATFAVTDWKNFWFLEPNSVGIGGVYYIPATCELIERWILPTLRRYLPALPMSPPDDIRQLLLKLFSRHARAIGRPLRCVALVEDRSSVGGTDEFGLLARYFIRQGLQAVVADPREISVHRGDLTVKRKKIDLIYRDSELEEILQMGRRSGPRSIAGIKEAFLRNRVISSIAGEFDHKSVWELFTSPEFARHFTFRQRRLFRDHLLWTRLLWERRTTDFRGRPVDLPVFARRNREVLTLKPNREYGGEGVLFGHNLTQKAWESHLERALRRPGTYVVQQRALVKAELFPVARPDGSIKLEPYYAVTGFAATQDGLAVLGRSSKEAVVNVSRKGGLISIWRLG